MFRGLAFLARGFHHFRAWFRVFRGPGSIVFWPDQHSGCLWLWLLLWYGPGSGCGPGSGPGSGSGTSPGSAEPEHSYKAKVGASGNFGGIGSAFSALRWNGSAIPLAKGPHGAPMGPHGAQGAQGAQGIYFQGNLFPGPSISRVASVGTAKQN